MSIEYRVIWKRADSRVKRKRYRSRLSALKMLYLLATKEPWTILRGYERKGADDLNCCDGRECGCGGMTVREYFEDKYKDYPAIEYAMIEQREVGKWTKEKPDGK